MCAEISALISVENRSLPVFCRRDFRLYSSAPALIICSSRTHWGPWEQPGHQRHQRRWILCQNTSSRRWPRWTSAMRRKKKLNWYWWRTRMVSSTPVLPSSRPPAIVWSALDPRTEKLGERKLTFCCPSLASRWTWQMSGDSLTCAIKTEGVSKLCNYDGLLGWSYG